jgi:hypothetical protein
MWNLKTDASAANALVRLFFGQKSGGEVMKLNVFTVVVITRPSR